MKKNVYVGSFYWFQMFREAGRNRLPADAEINPTPRIVSQRDEAHF